MHAHIISLERTEPGTGQAPISPSHISLSVFLSAGFFACGPDPGDSWSPEAGGFSSHRQGTLPQTAFGAGEGAFSGCPSLSSSLTQSPSFLSFFLFKFYLFLDLCCCAGVSLVAASGGCSWWWVASFESPSLLSELTGVRHERHFVQ